LIQDTHYLILNIMQLKTKVIATGVTNLHDARYCAGMGVEHIAFPIDPTLGNHISEPTWKEIAGWISGTKLGVEISEVEGIELDSFDASFYLTDNSELIDKFPEANFILRIKSALEAQNLLPKYKGKVEFFVLEWADSDLETALPQIKAYVKDYPIYIGFGITPENVESIISEIEPEGIALKGGKEIKVGLNDFDGLADVLEVIEVF
jgi:phosphoribosylanthranilate isomerase